MLDMRFETAPNYASLHSYLKSHVSNLNKDE
jgi:hypothetical protein